MGNSASLTKIDAFPGHSPPLQQYSPFPSTFSNAFLIWKHRLTNQSIIQYQFPASSEDVLHHHMKQYLWRHNHPLLVSTLFFQKKVQCQKYAIYYERVLTNLSRIKDLCVEDSFQFYYTAIKGFQLLFLQYGPFQVEQQMFHITKNKKAKVWCDGNISRLFPAVVGRLTESMMIRKIIQIIEKNTDGSKANYSVGKYLLTQKVCSFQQARQKFMNFCLTCNIKLGGNLRCVDILQQGGVSEIVDIYKQKMENKLIDKSGITNETGKSEKNTSTMVESKNCLPKHDTQGGNKNVIRQSVEIRRTNEALPYQIVRINNSVFVKRSRSRSIEKEKEKIGNTNKTPKGQRTFARNQTGFVEPTNMKQSESRIVRIVNEKIDTKSQDQFLLTNNRQRKFFNVFETNKQPEIQIWDKQISEQRSVTKIGKGVKPERDRKKKGKNYSPKIDSDIWDDMMRLRDKERISSIEV